MGLIKAQRRCSPWSRWSEGKYCLQTALDNILTKKPNTPILNIFNVSRNSVQKVSFSTVFIALYIYIQQYKRAYHVPMKRAQLTAQLHFVPPIKLLHEPVLSLLRRRAARGRPTLQRSAATLWASVSLSQRDSITVPGAHSD